MLGMIHYLSLGEFAERVDIAFDTMKKYRKEGRLPGEDGEVGRNRGWLPETADYWLEHRVGAGARTDLYDYTDPDRLPEAETTCVHYLSLGEFAERANISVNTMKGYRKDGRLPSEDGEVGRNRGWLPETADEWITALAR